MQRPVVLLVAVLCAVFAGAVVLGGCSPAGAGGGGGGSSSDPDDGDPVPLVSADAGGPYTALCANPEVMFDAGETVDPQGEIDVYRWYPGDGSGPVEHDGALSPDPHRYPGDHSGDGPAAYDVTLEVVDISGVVLDTAETVARIRRIPVAAFSCPTETVIGTETEFDAGASTDGDGLGYVAEYLWDFDFDGEFSATTRTAESVVTHVFHTPDTEGEHTTVALRVVDDDGFESELQQENIVVDDSQGAVIIIQ